MYIFIVLLTIQVFPIFAQTINEQKVFSPYQCKESKSPLLTNDNPHDYLDIKIITDFNTLLDKKDSTYRPAILSYDLNEIESVELPILIRGRGNSRRKYCHFIPLKIVFDKGDQLSAITNSKDLKTQYNAYSKYFNENPELYKDFQGYEQEDNIFKKVGKKAKIITHCGNQKNNNWILGGNEETQQNRVLQEHYIYKMISSFTSMSLRSKLLNITYLNKDGITLTTEMGIILEPKSSLAKRCSLSLTRNVSKANITAKKNIEFLNHFFYQKDYYFNNHNMIPLYSENEIYFTPYDYDLSGIIQPNYGKNFGHHSKYLSRFQDWLNKDYTKNKLFVTTQVNTFLNKEKKMRSMISDSFLSEKVMNDMLDWFDTYSQALKNTLDETSK